MSITLCCLVHEVRHDAMPTLARGTIGSSFSPLAKVGGSTPP